MTGSCAHCGQPVRDATNSRFCCHGCEMAFSIIHSLGLAGWYERRVLQDGVRPPRPEEENVEIDLDAYVGRARDGEAELHLMVEGLHCAACVWLIESVLSRQAGVTWARVNMSTRRLTLRWRPAQNTSSALVSAVTVLGYRLLPYDPARLASDSDKRDKSLLRAMAVAGFAAANIMLLSISVWAGGFSDMGPATRDFLHWISALIAVPAVAYAGQPFFRAALTALRAGRLNMDVPISLAVILAVAVSLFETAESGAHAYFDASVTLLFFLLIGRYLDGRARSRARSAAERLVALGATAATVIESDGRRRAIPVSQVRVGMDVLALPGERIAVDGRVMKGRAEVDSSLITGETVPALVGPGTTVYAGTLNLSGPLRIVVTAAGGDTLLGEIVRLVELAEQGRARFVALADRVARLYAPVVHVLGLVTFVGWLLAGAGWQTALLNAVAVLIITCPCALGLAVPAVQAVASGRLFRAGILVKTADALERLDGIDTVVFDKTGTLTRGRLELLDDGQPQEALEQAATLAAGSRHPLARALAAAVPAADLAAGLREVPGDGVEAGGVRLGRRGWAGGGENDEAASGPELWLQRPGRPALRFRFRDQVRGDAAATVDTLRGMGLRMVLLSGDNPAAVADVAGQVGIAEWRAAQRPDAKVAYLATLAAAGHRVLMVGDGLNDAPALAAAAVSMSPSTAADISQTAADLVFQGEWLRPVAEALDVARRAQRLMRQNVVLAVLYNAIAVPTAMVGLVTPLVAAAAMSSSSLLVILNSLRLRSAS